MYTATNGSTDFLKAKEALISVLSCENHPFNKEDMKDFQGYWEGSFPEGFLTYKKLYCC